MTYFHARIAACVALAILVAACDEQGNFNLGSGGKDASAQSLTGPEVKYTDEDVEAPEVFSATETGLWDGRPSLGGVWVAYPDVKQPERVIIRNAENGKFVVGALFRRERDIPGPRLQLSSDAAQAIDVLPGAPVKLSVVALRKQQVVEETTDPAPDAEAGIAPPAQIEEQQLDPIAAAGAAIDSAPPTNVQTATIAAAASEGAEPAAAASPQSEAAPSKVSKPFVQVAVFKVEENARQVEKQMQSLGLSTRIAEDSSDGTKLWRVLVGPAATKNDQAELLKKVRAEGYPDAYAVRR